ncbi:MULTISPECIES: acyl carrier protein [Streptomyces]|uniref:Polyketide-8 synthase acyl carrier protein n=10 Tax=Streptomyces TaxID=1883 RepID=A0A291SQG8_STRMQ|nr:MULTISPECIES: acyl carrier protein [Streptomyces]MEE4593865.1 acyl carrier protein [Streptomyces sp. DSM 41524]MYU13974.1 acyl carrier protein [Streptomyces sp. SID8361]AGP57569.1 polyketide-8 synthase acyl carrier protein [Streptomyces rapamycinicus NRRL 5491]AQA12087.1 polyketide-8 synthase acyl carrier protein [Streptomyces autolyticus]ATL83136.1 acyl carrier protein [Streptomyces malaysiensis]
MADATAALDMDELRTFVADVLDVDEEDVTDDADFVKTLGVDSLMALEVMVVLEKKYSVKLEEREMKDITTLRKVHDLLASKMGK